MTDRKFSVEDKYRVLEGRIAITGVQALVRVTLDQQRRDRAAGLHTATFVTGYQGSPLGELDKQFMKAGRLLEEHDIVWQAGINEELAATAVYGSQLVHTFPKPKYDGVLGMWYGKSPGVDRSMDALKHGNFIGASRYGGALALGGDDHAAKSSTLPCASDVLFYDANMPVLYPGTPQEVLAYGLHGYGMSRYSGLWVAIKIVTNVADGGSVVEVYPGLAEVHTPELEIDGKPFGNVQEPRLIPPYSVETERQIFYHRHLAAIAYARENGLNQITVRSASDRVGLISAGKSYYDLLQALELLGLGETELRQAGIRLLRMGMISPIEPQIVSEFAQGLEDIVVVEEKRGFMETLLRDTLYNDPAHPAIYGKVDAHGQPFMHIDSELQVDEIALALAHYLAEKLGRVDLPERVQWLAEVAHREDEDIMSRQPYFCSGCPHNTSTMLPEGAVAGVGVGCSAMAVWMDRGVGYVTQMGGEGAFWMGISPFTETEHFFQNMGDGTYFHSGSKALEAVVASGSNMTYKILYNSASAMTGGQDVVGDLPPIEIARNLVSQGVREVVIVPEDLSLYPQRRIGDKIRVAPKADYNQVMLDMQKVKGASVIIFDQQCAAEKRRERKRGIQPIPAQRVFINEGVCEGCGDCGVKSNCMSVIPVETDYGRKTRIHQSSCNLDYSCLQGDCPSFMTVQLAEGTMPVQKQGLASPLEGNLPEPAEKVSAASRYNVLMVGIGGTGVVTVDQLLVTAALLEGKYALHLDQTGLAQKGGPVLSNLILSESPILRANRIAVGETDTLLSFDFLASVSHDNLAKYHPERTRAVVNTTHNATAEVVTDIHAKFPTDTALRGRLERYLKPDTKPLYVDSERLNDGLFGNNLAGNVFIVGVAYQAGLIPLEGARLEEAIEANGVAVEQNLQAFRWGRQYVIDPERVERQIEGKTGDANPRETALERLRRWAPGQVAAFERLTADLPCQSSLAPLLLPRVADLILYQNPAYALTYLDFIRSVSEAEHAQAAGRTELSEAVARWLFKLMAYKDEYEVARLLVQDPAWEAVKVAYDGPLKRYYHLHPPLLRAMGMHNKLRLGEWFTPALRLLAWMKGIRGTVLDIFGRSGTRHEERRLIGWYRETVESLLPSLNHDNHVLAVQIASIPDVIRGYEKVKERQIREAEEELAKLLPAYHQPPAFKAAS